MKAYHGVMLLVLLLAGCAGTDHATGGAATAEVAVVSSYAHRTHAEVVAVNGRIRNDSRRGVQNVRVKAELRAPGGEVLGSLVELVGRMQPGEMQEYRMVIGGVPVGREFTARVWVTNADY